MSVSTTLFTAAATFGAAIAGAFFGVWLQHYLQGKDSQRRAHQEDIKKLCLIPLLNSLNAFYGSQLLLSENMPALSLEVSDVLSREDLERAYRATWGVLMMQGPALDIHHDLYDDLSNHFAFVKEFADRLDKGSEGIYTEYQVARHELFSKVYGIMAADRLSQSQEAGRVSALSDRVLQMQVLGRALFFLAIEKPIEEWPNLYSGSKSEIDRLASAIEAPEIRHLAERFNSTYRILAEECSQLRKELDIAIDSYKRLNGKCGFID